MLLVPEVSWSPVDGNSFDQALTDHGRTVTARVSVDASGGPTDFSTTDRFCYNPEQPKQLMRARWSTPVAGWTMVDGRQLPTAAQAVWHLPEGPFAYVDFRLVPGTLAFNVPPGIRGAVYETYGSRNSRNCPAAQRSLSSQSTQSTG
jgi:hypothetical protein